MCAPYEGSGAPLMQYPLRNVKRNEVAPGHASLPCLMSSSKGQINVYGDLPLDIADLPVLSVYVCGCVMKAEHCCQGDSLPLPNERGPG